MAEHYETLSRELKSEWVTILGQDDAITSDFDREVDAAIRFADSHGIGAISFRRAYFNWQDGSSDRLGYVAKYAASGSPRIRSSSFAMSLAVAGVISHFDLPQVYTNNLIKKEVIENVRLALGGKLIHEPIPDTFLGVAIASHTHSYLKWPTPAFWTGTSSVSVGHRDWPQNSAEDSLPIPEHIKLAIAEGREFGVGVYLWELAQSSPLMVYSARSVVQQLGGIKTSRANMIVAFGACLADSLIRFAMLSNHRLPPNLTSNLLRRYPGLIGRVTIVLITPGLVCLQLVSRITRKVRFDRLIRRSGFKIGNRVEVTVDYGDLNRRILRDFG